MMEPVEGAATFRVSGDAYGGFMGRYSEPLAEQFADWVGVCNGHRVLDVGCGPGALTGALVRRGAAVAACDPSPSFVEACAALHPAADVRAGQAEVIPFGDADFDMALAQLVLHFVTDPDKAVAELRRAVRPGGVVAACMWDFGEGMEMLRCFWDAALDVDPDAPDEGRTMRFGGEGEIAELFATVGLTDIEESTLEVTSTYRDVDELWSGFLAGIGPAGSYLIGLPDERRAAVRTALVQRLGTPQGEFTLRALARCARGTVEVTSTHHLEHQQRKDLA